ncbi:hypothetical protein L9F63_006467 [Diploptera punctata]|uniref:WD repeat-containing protein 74 n=1 Tax=Diploptera punctata TaxID=6984 RepID=A0AAD8E4Y0_DIPPU|nr:hypothetical protein L9F63_006467 [Diploptera punctata]
MVETRDFDLFVAGKIGSFKGISLDLRDECKKPVVKNIQNFKVLTKKDEITALAWSGTEDILIGLASQKVKISSFKAFSSNFDVNCGSGSIKGISRYNCKILTAVESGHVKIWSHSEENILSTGNQIEKMRHSSFNCEIIGIGGKENDLKLWNLEKKICTFTAKNVKPDMLQLRVPVWVSDLVFMPDQTKIATCSRYGHVRLYDPSTPQRRPVISMDIADQSFVSMSLAPRDNQVIVGSGKGKITLLDFRKKGIVQHYKGATGSVKSVECHKTEPYVVSVGLDRHLLVHNFLSKALIRKMYLKTRLNCVLLHPEAFMKVAEHKSSEKDDSDLEVVHDDYDEIFDNMEVVEEQPPRKKAKIKK